MELQQIVILLVGLLVGAGGVALGVWALPRLRNEEQGYPLEVQIEQALLPLAFQGICTAYRLSEWAMDRLETRWSGVDKKRVADALYDLMPDNVAGFPLEIIKAFVTRERFSEIVQAAFARFDRDFVAFQGLYEQTFNEWREEYLTTDAYEEAMAVAFSAANNANVE